MENDLVIFRKPFGKSIHAVSGNFQARAFDPSLKRFWIRPWEPNEPCYALENSILLEDREAIMERLQHTELSSAGGVQAHTQKEFTGYIQRIKSEIRAGDLEKAVSARAEKRPPVRDAWQTFLQLCETQKNTFNYLMYSKEWGCWMGASPEIFLKRSGKTLETVALAGTLTNEKEKFSAKELDEQGTVGKYISQILEQFQAGSLSVGERERVQASGLTHLKNNYRFELEEKDIPKFLQAFHPTPAVGGFPKKEALKIIAENEIQPRELYAGWLGFTHAGDFELFVNIRCAQLGIDGVVLYAGCGINADSDPEKEWKETEAKMEVMGRIIDI